MVSDEFTGNFAKVFIRTLLVQDFKDERELSKNDEPKHCCHLHI